MFCGSNSTIGLHDRKHYSSAPFDSAKLTAPSSSEYRTPFNLGQERLRQLATTSVTQGQGGTVILFCCFYPNPGGTHNEKNLSTKQVEAQAYPWVSRTYGNGKRPPGSQASPRERPRSVDGLVCCPAVATRPAFSAYQAADSGG